MATGVVALATLAASIATSNASIPTTYPTGSGVTIGYSGGHVVYGYDSNGDSIPDYSSGGYGGGGVVIPNPPVTTTLNPNASGDDTARIQAALDNIAAMPLNNGFRGVLKLNAGVYRITNALAIGVSGIVIRGAGSGTSGTILRRTVNNGDAITVDNGGGLKSQVGSTYSITTSYVPMGATYFALNSTSGLSVGDTISISRNPTLAWIAQLPESQTNRAYGVSWDRIITEIDANRIRIDAPIMQAIESQWGGGTVFKYTWTSRLSNVGIEDLRVDAPGDNVDSLGNTDGNFASFSHCINCWVRRCYDDKMRGHCVRFDGSKWCTAQDVTCFHNGTAQSHSGASIQIFCGSYSDSLLYQHISTYSGGFEFSAGRQHGGPIVYTESEVPLGFAASGPHEQGNAGMVWDNCTFTNQGVSVQYQGKGWGGFDCLAYNCDTDNAFNFERPNTVHQWLMGCRGSWNHAGNGNDPEVTSFGTHLSPTALYRAQLIDRLGATQAALVLGNTGIGDTDTGVSADFTVSATPSSQTVIAGNGTNYTVNVAAINGFNDTVSLTVSGFPSGASGNLNPTSEAGAGSSTLTVNTSTSTAPGNYTLTITGTSSANVTHNTTVTLSVITASGATTYEAESLAIAATSGDSVQTNTESGYSNGQGVQYNANGAGDFITFRLPNVAAGTYDVVVGYKTYTSRGIVQVSAGTANGTLSNVGSTFDEYGSPSSFTSTDLGHWTATTTGNQDFKFAITGHNASSSGFNETIDYIKLVPVSQPTTYEAESLAISATSGDTVSTNSESGASNGQYVQYYSTAANDYIVFTIPNVSPASYTVTIGYKQNSNRGIIQTQVGPAGGSLGNLGSAIDQYGGSAFLSVDIGTWTIGTSGDKSVKFLVTGKNASSSGYNLTVDYVKLTPQ
jgi:hypothetical protein